MWVQNIQGPIEPRPRDEMPSILAQPDPLGGLIALLCIPALFWVWECVWPPLLHHCPSDPRMGVVLQCGMVNAMVQGKHLMRCMGVRLFGNRRRIMRGHRG